MSAVCSTCGAEILWRKTEKGKTIPIDIAPVLGGNILLDDADGVVFLTRLKMEERRESGEAAYQSHFVSCPDAVTHRR